MGKTGWYLLVFLAAMACIHRAEAANFDATPSISLGAGWDSNIFNDATDEQDDYVFRAVPRLSFGVASPTVKMTLTGAVEGEKYADHDELDNADTTKSVDFRLVRTGPRLTFSPSARYVDTDDVTRRDIAAPLDGAAPPPGELPPESLITERVRSKVFSGSLQLSYLLSEKVTLGIGGSAARREFSENISGLVDSRTVTGNGSLSYRFSTRSSGGIFFDTAYNSFDDRPDSRSYSGGLRGSFLASEHTTLTGSAGDTYLRESTGVGGEVNEEWSPTCALSLAYAIQDFQATLTGSYAVSGGGSLGRTTDRGTVSLSLSDRLSPDWSWDLSGSWQSNRSTNGQPGTGENIEAASGTAGIRFQAASWASFRFSGNLYRQQSKSSVGEDIDRETVQLEVTLGHTYNLF